MANLVGFSAETVFDFLKGREVLRPPAFCVRAWFIERDDCGNCVLDGGGEVDTGVEIRLGGDAVGRRMEGELGLEGGVEDFKVYIAEVTRMGVCRRAGWGGQVRW